MNLARLDSTYQQILERLKLGERALVEIDRELIAELPLLWEDALEREDLDQLKKVLCLVDRSQEFIHGLAPLYERTLRERSESEILVFALGSVDRQLLTAYARLGERPPGSFMMCLDELLSRPLPRDVFEWVLRTLESMGPQSIMFKEKVLAQRPGVTRWFRAQDKQITFLIELLEQRWRSFAPPKSQKL